MSTSPRSASHALFARARQVIPGGVNSPVRAYRAVGGEPVVLARGAGCRVWDVDDRCYLDYLGSWGPLILGHAHPEILEVLARTAALGTTFGALTEREVVFAELLCTLVPCLEMVRLVSSGTEAVMSAIRLARAATGRELVIKFAGGYHGHSDGLLANAGSGVATLGIPGSPGVPEAFAALTLTIPFNDLAALQAVLRAHGPRVACLIGEPVPANMGVVLPDAGYWHEVQRLLRSAGVLLIFDEVITGFRLGLAGGQGWTGVTPDLCTLGKIIGGGLPVGAFGGRAELMRLLAPEGPVYQAGTLSGNPLAVAAGLATLRLLMAQAPYAALEEKTLTLVTALRRAAAAAALPLQVNHVGSMFTAFFTQTPILDYNSAACADTRRYAAFFHACLRRGVMFAPSQFEAAFLSTAHGDTEIAETAAVVAEALEEVAQY